MMHIWLQRAAFAAAGVSMGFTAYFGWITAGDDTFARYFNAAGGALISFAVPAFFYLTSLAEARNAVTPFRLFLCMGLLFGAMDASSNAGALFAMREGTKLDARHANTVAANATSTVDEIKADITRLRQVIEERATLNVPEAYEAEIFRLKNETERGRNIWQRSKECTDTTAETSRVVCQAIGVARENAAKAKVKVKAEADLAARMAQLEKATVAVEEKPGKVSPIDVITARVGAIAAWDLNPGENVQEFTYLLMTLVLGTALTLLSGGLGYGATWLRGPEPVAAHEPQSAFQTALAADLSRPGVTPSQPVTSRTIDGGNLTVNSYAFDTSTIDRMMAQAREIEAKHYARMAKLTQQYEGA